MVLSVCLYTILLYIVYCLFTMVYYIIVDMTALYVCLCCIVSEISCAKIRDDAPLDKICLFGCGVRYVYIYEGYLLL